MAVACLRRLLSLPAVFFFSQLAFADCDDEARAARHRVTASGPLHFQTETWRTDSHCRSCGSLDPGRAQYERNCDQDAGVVREDIRIDDQGWSNDGLGWQGPFWTSWGEGPVPPQVFPFQFVKMSCLGEQQIDGRVAAKYEFLMRSLRRLYVETVFIDASSGMPFRYEMRPEGREGPRSVTTYGYDSTIRIEPPVVDLEKRRATSMRRLSEAIAQSDPECRREVVALIRRGAATAFRYEIRGEFSAGVSGTNGLFAPPNSIHHRIKGVPYHGGGNEMIVIGADVWFKAPSQAWRSDVRIDVNSLTNGLTPPPSHIGSVRCPGMTTIEGQDYLVYEYDFYVDTRSARERDGLRRILVNPATELPVRIEHASRFGARVETRQYEEGLRIDAPFVPPPPPIPIVPFEEFRRRLFQE
jgi:hypothetical protein